MASTNTNWVYDKEKVTDASKKALDKAKRLEKERLENGWRWYSLSAKTKILVPFGSNGKPTKEGLRLIREAKEITV